jgi:hypothetical protein
MKPLTKSLILLAVVVFYAFLYWATSIDRKCDEDCQRIYQLDTILLNKYRYLYTVNRCGRAPTDTLCVYVRDTSGINWDRFADTVCTYANSVGLRQQQLFIIRNTSFPADTVARKKCP